MVSKLGRPCGVWIEPAKILALMAGLAHAAQPAGRSPRPARQLPPELGEGPDLSNSGGWLPEPGGIGGYHDAANFTGLVLGCIETKLRALICSPDGPFSAISKPPTMAKAHWRARVGIYKMRRSRKRFATMWSSGCVGGRGRRA